LLCSTSNLKSAGGRIRRGEPQTSKLAFLLLQPLQQIKINAVGIAKTNHLCAPRLILRLAVELNTFGLRIGINLVNILQCEAYMVDPGRILKQREISGYRCRIRFARLEDEKLGRPGHHRDSSLILICLDETKRLIELD